MKPFVLAGCIAALLSSSVAAEPATLWLVRPLYPGQEALVDRTEKALDKLMPGDARKGAVIGLKELSTALKGKKSEEVPCFSGDLRCTDPIDRFASTLGFGRIVLVQGGQDEAGFKYRVVSYEPAEGRVTPALAANAVLEKALLGAVAKVVPAASTLEVKSTPPGATVYVDDVKVGTTPLETQVLPGERVVKIDLKLHQPIEESLVIPIRGRAALERSLEKVAARIVITASPAGAAILVDGIGVGKDKVDRGIAPGPHTIRITADGHKAFEQQVTVKADEQYVLDKTLEPLPGNGVAPQILVVRQGPDGAVKIVTEPPKPATPTEDTYSRQLYVQGGFEMGFLNGSSLFSQRFGDNGSARTARLVGRECTGATFASQGLTGTCAPNASTTLIGGNIEVGIFGSGPVGRFFGLGIFGFSYLTNLENSTMEVGWRPDTPQATRPEPDKMGMLAPFIIKARMHLMNLKPLHFLFRVAIWRVQLSLGAGFEFRLGGVIEPENPFYKDGFFTWDLLLTTRAQARVYVADGFYLYGAGNYTFTLPWLPNYSLSLSQGNSGDEVSIRSARGIFGFNVGLGYGFP
jgi:hypothetical protein